MFRVLLSVSTIALLLLAACGLVTPTTAPAPLATQAARVLDLHLVSSWQREGSSVFPPVAATIDGRDYLFFGTTRNSPPNDHFLNVLDVTDPASPRQAAQLPSPYWINYSLVLVGTTLYAAVGEGFWTVDVSDPAAPRPLSVLSAGGYPNDPLFLAGNCLYTNVWDRTYSIQVIDISDPASPRLAASVPVSSGATIGEASGSRLYCSGQDGFRIMDISSPLEPRQIGFYADVPGDVAVSGNYAFIASGLSGLRVLDISDPSNIREVTKKNLADWVYSISIYGNLALVMGAYEQPFHFEMLALDISVPDDPRVLDRLEVPIFTVYRSMRLGDHVYVNTGAGSLWAVALYADGPAPTVAATPERTSTPLPMLHYDGSYSPKAVSDGTGSVLAFYEAVNSGGNRDFYVQKMDSNGKMLWGEKGVLIGSGYKQFAVLWDSSIVSDGSGGAIVAWEARTSSQGAYVNHVTRVSADGLVVWDRGFERVSQLMGDGAGGAIIAADYISDREELFVVRIDSGGGLPWGEDGALVNIQDYQANSLNVAGDGAGGALVVWAEAYRQSMGQGQPVKVTQRILAQRVNSDGNLSWMGDGVVLCAPPETLDVQEPQVIGDGSGGAIATWFQAPRGRIVGGSPEALLWDICVQRVDANGKVLWQQNGVSLEIAKASGRFNPVHSPLLASDGSGGAIIIWEDLRQGLASIYAQRVGPDGALQWQAGGVQACYVDSGSSFVFRQIVADGLGGAIVACRFNEAGTRKTGVLVQRLDSAGKTLWPGSGIVVADSDTTGHSISSDGQGGAIVARGILEGIAGPEKSYMQRVDSSGELLWGAEGLRLDQ